MFGFGVACNPLKTEGTSAASLPSLGSPLLDFFAACFGLVGSGAECVDSNSMGLA